VALDLTKEERAITSILKKNMSSPVNNREIPQRTEQFLDFLSRDIAANPQRLQPLTIAFFDRLDALVGDIEVNLDEILPKETDDLNESFHEEDALD
jgi:hypothetical protein